MDPVKLPWEKTFDNGREEHWGATTQIGTYSFFFVHKEYNVRSVQGHPMKRKAGDCDCSFGKCDHLDVTGCKSVDDLKTLAEKDYYDKTHEFSGDIFECPKAWITSASAPEFCGTTMKFIVEVPDTVGYNACFTGSGVPTPKEAQ